MTIETKFNNKQKVLFIEENKFYHGKISDVKFIAGHIYYDIIFTSQEDEIFDCRIERPEIEVFEGVNDLFTQLKLRGFQL